MMEVGTREERLIKIHFKGSFGLAELKVIVLHSPQARIGDVFSYFVLQELEYSFSVTMGAFSLTMLNNRLCQFKLLSRESGLSTALRVLRHINPQELEYPKTTVVTYRADSESIFTLWLRTTLQIMALYIAFSLHQTILTKQTRSPAVG